MSENSINSENPNVSLYFGGLKNSPLLNDKDDGALKFIILQNDQFHQEIDKIKEKCKVLEAEIMELEASNDSLEKTRKCLQGYIKNEHDVATSYKELYEITNKRSNSLALNRFLSMIIFGISNIINNYYVSLMISIGIITYMFYDFNSYTSQTKRLNVILKRIKETEKSNSYLDELIDNM